MRTPDAERQPAFEIEEHSNGSRTHRDELQAAFDIEEHSNGSRTTSNTLEFAEIVARRTAEILLDALDQRAHEQHALVDAKTIAAVLGVSRDHVYRNADRLGAIRVGGALRFDPDRVTSRSTSRRSPDVEAPGKQDKPERPRGPRSRVGARQVPTVPLLPVGSAADRRRRAAGQ